VRPPSEHAVRRSGFYGYMGRHAWELSPAVCDLWQGTPLISSERVRRSAALKCGQPEFPVPPKRISADWRPMLVPFTSVPMHVPMHVPCASPFVPRCELRVGTSPMHVPCTSPFVPRWPPAARSRAQSAWGRAGVRVAGRNETAITLPVSPPEVGPRTVTVLRHQCLPAAGTSSSLDSEVACGACRMHIAWQGITAYSGYGSVQRSRSRLGHGWCMLDAKKHCNCSVTARSRLVP
jgi:hypothetical protein